MANAGRLAGGGLGLTDEDEAQVSVPEEKVSRLSRGSLGSEAGRWALGRCAAQPASQARAMEDTASYKAQADHLEERRASKELKSVTGHGGKACGRKKLWFHSEMALWLNKTLVF